MAKSRVRFRRDWRDELFSDPRVAGDLDRRGKALVATLNSESSWGGYEGELDTSGSRPRFRVWDKTRRDGNRMVIALGRSE